MCRCLQNLWEDWYWHCIEEKFCFDETIAYYNPDEDGAATTSKKDVLDAEFIDRKNSEIIVNQPLARHCSMLGAKAHEDDFQREIQTTVPILAPEVMAAFAQSQIFHEHSQKPKAALVRIETKAKITAADVTGHQDQDAAAEKLLSRLEGLAIDDEKSSSPVVFKLAENELSVTQRTQTFQSIAEEVIEDGKSVDKVDYIPKHQREISSSSKTLSPPVHKKLPPAHLRLKHVQSVPQLPTYPGALSSAISRPWSQAGETMTRDGVFIINTPEVPAISLKKLPRNYLETPSIDQYYQPSSASLNSIQMKNKQRVDDMFNFQMPRYYGHSELYLPTPAISQEEINRSNLRAAKQARMSFKKNQSMINLHQRSSSPDPKYGSTQNIGGSQKQLRDNENIKTDGGSGVEKSKRLKILRDNLPPLMIHSSAKGGPERDRH